MKDMQIPYRKPGKYSQEPFDPYITEAKFKELESKLAQLTKKRPKLAMEVSRLAEMGDFSENVEYQLAKGRLRGINNMIMRLEHQLNHSTIIKTGKETGVVNIGSIVTVLSKNQEKVYQILGSSEINPEKGIISHSSPIGSALLGHREGETVQVSLKDRELEYKIVKIR